MMKIIVRNNTSLPNKHIRFIKWKIYGLKEKFKHLHYAEIFLKEEGNRPKQYYAHLRLGITGHDIIIKQRSSNIQTLLMRLNKDAHRYLAGKTATKTNYS